MMEVTPDKSLARVSHTDGHCNTDVQQVNAESPNEQQPTCQDPLRWRDKRSSCHKLPASYNSQETNKLQVHQARSSVVDTQELVQVKESTEIYLERVDKTQVDSKRADNERSTREEETRRSNHHNYHHLATSTRQQHLNQSQTTTTYHPREEDYQSKHHQRLCLHNHLDGTRFQSQPSHNLTHTSTRSQHKPQLRCHSITASLPGRILVVIVLNAILNQLSHIVPLEHATDGSHQLQFLALPSMVMADVVNECVTDSDCGQLDKTCYENKCICKRAKPIEDKDRSLCLPHASLNEPCDLSDQCIGNSVCTDGYCLCPTDSISIFNPSTKLHYCHPKRGLREECNYDSQCPDNSFCSTKKYGCLCQNGFGSGLVINSSGVEQYKCLPKTCRFTAECESEYHICDENKCKCLATHFDPHKAECYKFGSTGGHLLNGNITILNEEDPNRGLTSVFNDLMGNGDKLWLVVMILAVLMLIFLAILIFVLRKYYLGYCWTHTKEYEPNNEQSPKNGQFSKNSINNKSFRKKSAELEDENGSGGDDDTAADRSNLVTAGKKNGSLLNESAFAKQNGGAAKLTRSIENHYVQVDMRGANDEEAGDESPLAQQSPRSHHQIITRPLPSSTSTPV